PSSSHHSHPSPPPTPTSPSRKHSRVGNTIHLTDVAKRIRTSKRLVVVCGAGISTSASIPDFRSSAGLFSASTSAKDLFHVKCLSSPALLPLHHELINTLSALSAAATPTPFHAFLKHAHEEGRLKRCFTQNIDGLERKAGLEVGIGSSSTCIPLHGQLDSLTCTLCPALLPLSTFLPLPLSPTPIACPTCSLEASLRLALSERARPTGTLRANIVLYGEEHPQGERIGHVIEKDIRSTVDLLLVAGTSLLIPGVKKLVKDISRSIRRNESHPRGIRTVLLNEQLPKGEWKNVFDVWVKGDIQDFVVDYLATPSIPTSTPRKSAQTQTKPTSPPGSSDFSTPRKHKAATVFPPTPRPTPPFSQAKRQREREPDTTPTKPPSKRQRVTLPPASPSPPTHTYETKTESQSETGDNPFKRASRCM
ncbi:hypothetical protein P7C73_g6645, partial [Tremellales sp. Uapishka_1]